MNINASVFPLQQQAGLVPILKIQWDPIEMPEPPSLRKNVSWGQETQNKDKY